MYRKSLLVLLLSALSLGFQGCGSDSTGPDEPDWVGSYALETVEGSALPVVLLQIGNDKIEVTTGSVTLNEDQTFSTNMTYRVTEAGSVSTGSDSQVGSFTKNGTALRFNYSDGTQDTGSLNGEILTLTSEGVTFVFHQ